MCEPLLCATLLEDPVWAKSSQSMTMGSLQSREETEDCHCWRGKVVSLWIVMVLGRWRVKGRHRQEVHRVLKSNPLCKAYIEGTTWSHWHSSHWVPTSQDFMTAAVRRNTSRARVWGWGGHLPSQRKPCTLHVLHVTPELHLLLLLPSFSSVTPQAAWSSWSRSPWPSPVLWLRMGVVFCISWLSRLVQGWSCDLHQSNQTKLEGFAWDSGKEMFFLFLNTGPCGLTPFT